MTGERKCWVVEVPPGGEYPGFGPGEVMIEQFGDDPPLIAFRPERWTVWSRPVRSVVAP